MWSGKGKKEPLSKLLLGDSEKTTNIEFKRELKKIKIKMIKETKEIKEPKEEIQFQKKKESG